MQTLCLECEANLSLDADLLAGELVACPDCGAELERPLDRGQPHRLLGAGGAGRHRQPRTRRQRHLRLPRKDADEVTQRHLDADEEGGNVELFPPFQFWTLDDDGHFGKESEVRNRSEA